MTTKTITTYICERCDYKSDSCKGWKGLVLAHTMSNFIEPTLCPACSKRALEKPEPDPFHCAKCGERFADGFGGVCCYGGKNYHFPSCQ
jgi:hypothetical protein